MPRASGGTFYPLALRLRGRPVLVVGGGKVAERKTSGLLASGARVVVVSPVFSLAFLRLAKAEAVTCVQRPYEAADVTKRALVIAATDDSVVNARVRADARRAGILVSVADAPEKSDFIVPAVVRRGDLTLAISTGGASPALSGQLKRELERLVPEEWTTLIELLVKARRAVQRAVAEPARRRALLRKLGTLDLLSVARTYGNEVALRQIHDLLSAPTAPASIRAAEPPRARRTRGRPAPAERRTREALIQASPRSGNRRIDGDRGRPEVAATDRPGAR